MCVNKKSFFVNKGGDLKRRERKRLWTPEEDQQVLAQIEESDSVLADLIGRSVFAIQKRRERLRAKKVQGPPEMWEVKLKEVELGTWKRATIISR